MEFFTNAHSPLQHNESKWGCTSGWLPGWFYCSPNKWSAEANNQAKLHLICTAGYSLLTRGASPHQDSPSCQFGHDSQFSAMRGNQIWGKEDRAAKSSNWQPGGISAISSPSYTSLTASQSQDPHKCNLVHHTPRQQLMRQQYGIVVSVMAQQRHHHFDNRYWQLLIDRHYYFMNHLIRMFNSGKKNFWAEKIFPRLIWVKNHVECAIRKS